MHPYLKPLEEIFRTHEDPVMAAGMKKYMRGQYEYFGIKSPMRRELSGTFHDMHGLPDNEEVDPIVRSCWEQPQRDYQYFAMEMLRKIKRKAGKERIILYEYMTVNKSWWDTVDYIAGVLVADHFTKFPGDTRVLIPGWMDSGNMWLQRTCLLYQLHYRKQTDTVLLTKLIDRLSDSKEFFIRKAIGWILREYSKTDPSWVVEFVGNHPVSAFSRKEALKWMERKKTSGS